MSNLLLKDYNWTTFWCLMGKKRCTWNDKIKGKGKIFSGFFCLYSKLKSKNLPVLKEQEISYVKKKTRKYKIIRTILTNDERNILNTFCCNWGHNCLSCGKWDPSEVGCEWLLFSCYFIQTATIVNNNLHINYIIIFPYRFGFSFCLKLQWRSPRIHLLLVN